MSQIDKGRKALLQRMSDNSIETSKYRVDNSERKHSSVEKYLKKNRAERGQNTAQRLETSENSVEIRDVRNQSSNKEHQNTKQIQHKEVKKQSRDREREIRKQRRDYRGQK